MSDTRSGSTRSRSSSGGGGTEQRSGSSGRRSRTRLGVLFHRANAWQKVIAVACAVVAVHGVYVLFVPGVALEEDALDCPPAAAAAVAGKGGVTTPDGFDAGAHDAACASTGRWWALAAGGQTAIAALWGLAVLEWGRVWRRARRRRRRQWSQPSGRRSRPGSQAGSQAGSSGSGAGSSGSQAGSSGAPTGEGPGGGPGDAAH